MEHTSFWRLERPPAFSPLPGDTEAEAVIVGAGICGLLCAYFLQNKGMRDIVVIDAGEVCGGVTADTTAKITSQHGLIYAKLTQGMGQEAAARYADVNEAAIGHFRSIIETEQIECDFTPCHAWVYTTAEQHLSSVEREVEAANRAGIRATFDTNTELPFRVKGAVKFPNQAHFHPLKFAHALCRKLESGGCRFYTHTKATGVEDGLLRTDRGHIKANHILSCSHYPFVDKTSLLFTKIYQDRSYVLALKGTKPIRDMYIDCADNGLSFRPQKDQTGEDMLLLGAYDHKSGHEDTTLHFEKLAREAHSLYPAAKVAYAWSAQDCMTHDGIPYIGRCPGMDGLVSIATGFHKWGMTSSMAAADILSDMVINGYDNEHDLFALNSRDIGMQAKSFVTQAVDIAGNFLTHLTMADGSLGKLANGQGGVVEHNGLRVGVYRDYDGKLHAVKTACTHMGCAVRWNRDENTWDCTCHGSRFDPDGQVLSGPALKPLEPVSLEDA